MLPVPQNAEPGVYRLAFELFLLEEGQTLPQKAAELLKRGVIPATADEIEIWIGDGEALEKLAPIVVADPAAEPRVSCADSEWPIIQVPAYGIEKKGQRISRGWIDLFVPMHPRAAGGQLAVLGVMP